MHERDRQTDGRTDGHRATAKTALNTHTGKFTGSRGSNFDAFCCILNRDCGTTCRKVVGTTFRFSTSNVFFYRTRIILFHNVRLLNLWGPVRPDSLNAVNRAQPPPPPSSSPPAPPPSPPSPPSPPRCATGDVGGTCGQILYTATASGCLVECRIYSREVAGSNLGRRYFAPRSTQPSILPGSVNEYQLRLGRQRYRYGSFRLRMNVWVCR